MNRSESGWPPLPIKEWQDTCDTLHMWLQIAGKTRMALSPHVNHWWETPFYLTSRGLTSSPIPWKVGAFEVRFDFLSHHLLIETSWGPARSLPLSAKPVADFYAEFFKTLRELEIEVSINPSPSEFPGGIRFDEDRTNASYDAPYAHRFWRILLTVDGIFKEFRSRFMGKVSPVHLFWGSMDIAVTRFSGRTCEPIGADAVTRESYSREQISAGWWPGGGGYDASFYAYARPEPKGYPQSRQPAGVAYDEKIANFLLPYEDVRQRADPRATLLEFLESTYAAAAELGGWDRPVLERPK